MKRRNTLIIVATTLGLILSCPLATARQIPMPAEDHPGNIFVAGQEVSAKVDENLSPKPVRWRAMDDRGSIVGQGQIDSDNIKLGDPGIGWYRIEFLDDGGAVVGWTTAAVLARLAEPTPQDSPICVDSATAWFANGDATRQGRFAQLAALAGANWIRDRLSWNGIHRGPDEFAENTTYDSAASLQARYGLKLLQVFHDSPGWAVDKQLDDKRGTGRFTRDLRILYKFCKTMSKRYEGRVLAWEPWNEGNIDVFGGHTIDEMCSHQKAAYLAFKAGNPNVTVCWNVYAGSGSELHAQGVIENESWPYFETYNIHSYSKPKDYAGEFSPAREASCGRPIWITECGVPLPWKSGGPGNELSQADELEQARFLARSYASSLFAGVERHFFFILGNYAERNIQFGLLRDDQTPRPGYVALAGVGRFLAGAKCLGRMTSGDEASVQVYAFGSQPDGKSRDVLIVWADKATTWRLPEGVSVEVVYDYLGRPLGKDIPESIESAPLFVILPQGKAAALSLEAPLHGSAFRQSGASPVVLQLQMPQSATDLGKQAHKVDLKDEVELDVFAYNFGDDAVAGTVSLEHAPDGWRLIPGRIEIEIEPMGRKHLPIRVGAKKPAEGWIKLRGDFSEAGRPVLAFRLVPK
ncbi:MAG: hypothetical protein JXN61_02975 [Sedimentisphaerales bacterium]|nr:hypothetical protein [Sedimentisphaerales bacterium]